MTELQLDVLDRKDKVADVYLCGLDAVETSRAESIADQLQRHDTSLADTVVIVPVAVPADAELIPHALREYARQRTAKQFSVVLGLNVDSAHTRADDPGINLANKAIDTARSLHPELDVRASFTAYENPTIGQIRRDLWNGVLALHARQNTIDPTREIIGINHDIDVVKLPSQYIGAVQRRVSHPARAVSPFYTQSRHAWDHAHPHISGLVYWDDFINASRQIGYEAAAVIPMSYYSDKNGIDASRRTHEIGSLIDANHPARLVRTGYLETSPRRFVDRLARHGFEGIWTADSFGTQDACRNPEQMREMPDIKPKSARTTLQAIANGDIERYIPRLITQAANSFIQNLIEIDERQSSMTIPEAVSGYYSDAILHWHRFGRLAKFALSVAEPKSVSPVKVYAVRHHKTFEQVLGDQTDRLIATLSSQAVASC